MSDWQLASPLKLTLIVGVTFSVTLLTYELAVRYTWIGAVLHRRKYRKTQTQPVATKLGFDRERFDAAAASSELS
jgi:hypothetical protein